jgi:hypothetical protein
MKKYLLTLVCSVSILGLYAQSTEILPGNILPKLTTAQRTALASPVDGMLVFDSNTQSYWYRKSAAWTELPQNNTPVNFWQQTGAGGNEIMNTNTGGFWSANPSAVSVFSPLLPASAPVSGEGTRMMWISSRSAFRVGTVRNISEPNDDKVWDKDSIGIMSFAAGLNTKAKGTISTAFGAATIAIGSSSFAAGVRTLAAGNYSTALGEFTISRGESSLAVGVYNADNVNGLFMVGNGSSPNNRYSTFIVRKDNNRVGVNMENPLASLHVGGFGFTTTGQGGFFYPTEGLTYNTNWAANLGILADQGIVSKTFVGSAINVIASDSRIKKDLSLSNNSEDLALLKKIEITNYRMKDLATWGTQNFKKVIAQQVESIYPEVIKLQTSVIPDIYTLAESVQYNAKEKQLSITLSKSYDIKIGEKIELVHFIGGKILAEVIAVNGETFTVKDWVYPTDKIFVFGREVNDFRTVDYEALSMLGISAIQALAKENEEMKKEIIDLKKLKNRIEALEASFRPFHDGK